MGWFIVGMVFGGVVSFIVTCLCQVAKKSDEQLQDYSRTIGFYPPVKSYSEERISKRQQEEVN